MKDTFLHYLQYNVCLFNKIDVFTSQVELLHLNVRNRSTERFLTLCFCRNVNVGLVYSFIMKSTNSLSMSHLKNIKKHYLKYFTDYDLSILI